MCHCFPLSVVTLKLAFTQQIPKHLFLRQDRHNKNRPVGLGTFTLLLLTRIRIPVASFVWWRWRHIYFQVKWFNDQGTENKSPRFKVRRPGFWASFCSLLVVWPLGITSFLWASVFTSIRSGDLLCVPHQIIGRIKWDDTIKPIQNLTQ